MERVAFVCGYDGSGYFGLQRQSDSAGKPTVEQELERALVAAGAMQARNAGALHKVNWSRTSRTDKGVSAAANVISLDIPAGAAEAAAAAIAKTSPCPGPCPGGGGGGRDLAPLVARMNTALPATVHVWSASRPGPAFDARRAAYGRRYEYLVPVWALDPEVGKRRTQPSQQPPQQQDQRTQPRLEQIQRPQPPQPQDQPQQPQPHQRHLAAAAALADGGSTTAERSRRRAESEIAASRFQLTPLELKRLNLILGVFVGSHCFHNFTSEPSEDPEQLRRTIHRAYAEGPVHLAPQPPTSSCTAAAAATAAPAPSRPAAPPAGRSPQQAPASSQAGPHPQPLLQPRPQPEPLRQPHQPRPQPLLQKPEPLLPAQPQLLGPAPSQAPGCTPLSASPTASGPAAAAAAAAAAPSALRPEVEGGGERPHQPALAAAPTAAVSPTPYVRIVFVGSGFLMHQIRRMVGLVLAVARRAAPPDCLRTALDPGRHFLTVPTAPPTGLLMDRAFFTAESYRRACETSSQPSRGSQSQHQQLQQHAAMNGSCGGEGSSARQGSGGGAAAWLSELERGIAAGQDFKQEVLYPALDAGPVALWSFLCGLTEAAYGFRSWATRLPVQSHSQGQGPARARRLGQGQGQGQGQGRDGAAGAAATAAAASGAVGTGDGRVTVTVTSAEERSCSPGLVRGNVGARPDDAGKGPGRESAGNGRRHDGAGGDGGGGGEEGGGGAAGAGLTDDFQEALGCPVESPEPGDSGGSCGCGDWAGGEGEADEEGRPRKRQATERASS